MVTKGVSTPVRLAILTSLSLLLAGCTTHGMSGTGAMGDHLAEAEEELDRHHGVVMDATAISLCMDNKLPIVVFNLRQAGNIRRVVLGDPIGTTVSI